jgi:hypothetical protein
MALTWPVLEETTGDRAKRGWELIFKAAAMGDPLPRQLERRTPAGPEDVAELVFHLAAMLDDLLETGTIEPWRVREALLQLFLTLDTVTPLPEDIVSAADLLEVLESIRFIRHDPSFPSRWHDHNAG